LFLTSCSYANIEIEEPKIENYQVSLVAVGDNLIHSPIYKAAATGDSYDFKPMLAEIKPYINTFDLAFINQETIIGGSEIGLSSYPCFNSPYELGDAIVDAGFNLISIANNHTLDRGKVAVLNSLDYWDSQDVIYSGASRSYEEENIKKIILNNISFAFVAYTYGTNGIPHPNNETYLANLFSEEKAERDVNLIRDEVDVIICSMHWGDEYQDIPNEKQIHQAEYLSSLGVDIILGHHPHVIQPVDKINQTIVVYSLGNFLSAQIGVSRTIGMAFSLDINKRIENDEVKVNYEKLHAKILHHFQDENKDFHIKLFSELNNEILYDYQVYLNEKKALIKSLYDDISID